VLAEEHRAFRERAGIIDMSSFGKIDVSGPGALKLLERAAGNLIDRPVGTVVYTQLLETNGGIAADVTVTRLDEERFRVVTGAGYVHSDLGWLRLQVDRHDPPVELRETTEELSVIGLWGPRARDILERVTAEDISDDALPFMHARQLKIGGGRLLAQRVTYVGELGWELYVEPGWAGQVWDRLMEAGRPYGIHPGGYRALDSLRMEKGYRYYGTDLTLLDNPLEAGLGFCVCFDKEDFNGRHAVLAARVAGLKRRLRTLVIGGDAYLPIYGGEAVHRRGKVIGRLRSCAYGFTVRKNLAYAYLPTDIKPGGQVEVEVFGDLIPAAVVSDAVIGREKVSAATQS
jgi:glycine cleavage system aminomethyltransferase T